MSQDNIKCEAPAEQAGVGNNSTCKKKNGEENQAKVASNTPSNRIEQDTSINKRTLKQQIKQEEEEKEEQPPSPPLVTRKSSGRRRKKKATTMFEEIGVSYEEEKMLSLAIKNSIREQKSSSAKDFSKVKEMVTYHPTEEEFRDPIKYIEGLFEEGAWKYGCVKIIPPESFKPEFSFDTQSDAKLPTRFQTLQDLSQGKSFVQNEEGICFKDFRKQAEEFQTKFYAKHADKGREEMIAELEKEYWRYVEDNLGDRVKVQYAADLPSKKFGSGFPSAPENQYSSHPWNLNNMDKIKNSLLQVCEEKISGINMPWVYAGMLYSSFCWHYEDVMMYSINYMHEGEGKMWYAIPSQDARKFERIAKDKLAILFDEDPNILLNITAMISPQYLAENGVNVYKTEQRPGEFILTFPESYHAGWSTGFNVAEAVNIVMKSWIDYGIKSLNIYLKTREKVPVFSMDWISTENIRAIAYPHLYPGRIDMDNETKLEVIRLYEETILREEVVERAMVRSHYADKTKLFKTIIKKFPAEQLESTDNIECHYCINLCYLSYVKCLKCKKIYCIAHELQCGCDPSRIRIHERYTDEELNQFLEDAKKNVRIPKKTPTKGSKKQKKSIASNKKSKESKDVSAKMQSHSEKTSKKEEDPEIIIL